MVSIGHVDPCQTLCKQVPDFARASGSDSPLIGVRFRESLVITRLHSEIDQIHLSIEAQCVTARLPLGDCHI